ncbi:hypothetical protein BsWGS_00407 [Bradybaena similaris]
MSPKRSDSRSRSRSPLDDRRKYQKRYSRDRSQKSSRRRDERSRSYSPGATRDSKDRDDPNVCHCLGVFGLSSHTQEKELRDVFSAYGDIDDICIIYDRQTGQSKGYGFVYFKSTSDATEARRNTQGLVLDRRPIRVDYSLTLRPHSPTPGRYLGRRSSRDYDRHYRDDDYDDRPSYRDNRDYRDYRDNRRSGYRDWR